MGYKEALQFLGRDGTEAKTEPAEIKIEGKHVERVAPSDMLDNPAPVPEAETNEQELDAPQLPEESAEHHAEQPTAKEPATKLGEQPEVEGRQATPAQIGKIEAETVEGTGQEGGAEGNLKEIAADEAALDSVEFLRSKAADDLEPRRATLAAATVFPLSLLGTKKAWMWIAVLVGIAMAGYFFLRWYSRRGESTSLPKEASQTSSGDPVRDFLDNY